MDTQEFEHMNWTQLNRVVHDILNGDGHCGLEKKQAVNRLSVYLETSDFHNPEQEHKADSQCAGPPPTARSQKIPVPLPPVAPSSPCVLSQDEIDRLLAEVDEAINGDDTADDGIDEYLAELLADGELDPKIPDLRKCQGNQGLRTLKRDVDLSKRMFCYNCGSTYADYADLFCPVCGESIWKAELDTQCPCCHEACDSQWHFCIHCGIEINEYGYDQQ